MQTYLILLMRSYLIPTNKTFENFMFYIFTSCFSVYLDSVLTNFTPQFDLASFVRDVVNPIMMHFYFVWSSHVLHLYPVRGKHAAACYGCSAYMVRHKPVSRAVWDTVLPLSQFAISIFSSTELQLVRSICYIARLTFCTPLEEPPPGGSGK